MWQLTDYDVIGGLAPPAILVGGFDDNSVSAYWQMIEIYGVAALRKIYPFFIKSVKTISVTDMVSVQRIGCGERNFAFPFVGIYFDGMVFRTNQYESVPGCDGGYERNLCRYRRVIKFFM